MNSNEVLNRVDFTFFFFSHIVVICLFYLCIFCTVYFMLRCCDLRFICIFCIFRQLYIYVHFVSG